MFEITTTMLGYICIFGSVAFVLLAYVLNRLAAAKKRAARRAQTAAIRARRNIDNSMFNMLDNL